MSQAVNTDAGMLTTCFVYRVLHGFGNDRSYFFQFSSGQR